MFRGISSLSDIYLKKSTRRKRVSSWDKKGGNADYIVIAPGQEATLCDVDACGIVNHIWMTMKNTGGEECYYRKLVLKIFYDGEREPSVLAPVGDFFGMGHGIVKNFVSAPLQMSPENGRGFNSWWPMPFGNKLTVRMLSECTSDVVLYYYVDYEESDALPVDALRFHACYRQSGERSVPPISCYKDKLDYLGGQQFNLDGKDNYVVLEAVGAGHYCGCNLNVFNTSADARHDWIGEGDDMIFIDGEEFPPTLHGTGTEDYFNTAYCPTQEYCAPYHGIILAEKENWKGRTTYYRYHIQDPVTFEKSIRVTIEQGHNNQRDDDWSSTAYWYQTEPHAKFGLPPVEERMPLDEKEMRYYARKTRLKP